MIITKFTKYVAKYITIGDYKHTNPNQIDHYCDLLRSIITAVRP